MKAPQTVIRACLAMHAVRGPLPMSRLLEEAHVARETLDKEFRKVFGINVQDYGLNLRDMSTRHTLASGRGDSDIAGPYDSVHKAFRRIVADVGIQWDDALKGGPQHVVLWSTVRSPLGFLSCVAGPLGIHLITHNANVAPSEQSLCALFPRRTLHRDDSALQEVMASLLRIVAGEQVSELPVDVAGTQFQAQTWSALKNIPFGQTRTYSQIASLVGSPSATRAVGSACGANPVPLVVPCHRVVRADGSMGGFGWGLGAKEALLNAERPMKQGSP